MSINFITLRKNMRKPPRPVKYLVGSQHSNLYLLLFVYHITVYLQKVRNNVTHKGTKNRKTIDVKRKEQKI